MVLHNLKKNNLITRMLFTSCNNTSSFVYPLHSRHRVNFEIKGLFVAKLNKKLHKMEYAVIDKQINEINVNKMKN